MGPSPRVRGKPSEPHSGTACEKVHPACAGETWKLAVKKIKERVHPRVCGGNPLAKRTHQRR